MNTILLNPDGSFKVIPFNEATSRDRLDFWYKHLDCDCVDIVRAVISDENTEYVLVVDDEGLMKNPALNLCASLLYGYLEHGQPIVGKAMICKSSYTEDGTDTIGLTDPEVKIVLVKIAHLLGKYIKGDKK